MCRTSVFSFLTALTLSGFFNPRPGAAQQPCESLAKLSLPDTKITLAQSVAAGAFIPPPSPFPTPGGPPSYKDLPAFCRIVAEVAPTADSDIKIEVWMPASGWNGKYRGQGNGGFAGIIDYPGMGAAMRRGYATAGTDTGHSGFDAAWALGHPEKVKDFGYRGIHEMTLKGKAIMHAFYGDNPRHSYFASCSDGGREALMEAQRFPEDYDGILAGAPANFWTRLLLGGMWTEEAITVDPASYIPAAKLPALSAAVLAACDAQDGLADGILDDPRQCHFDPATLVCKEADSNACLSAPQAAALKKIYAGPHDSAGHQLFPGYLPGGEEGPGGWGIWITGSAPGRSLMSFFGVGYFSEMVYEKADWDYKTFDVDAALKLAEAKTAHALNATDPDLKPFQTHGGKLIVYHGWADAAIPAPNSINYYASVVAAMGQPDTDSFLRLFMVPGMQHCTDGPGPNSFGQAGSPTPTPDDPDHNAYTALELWVEKGVAPSRIIATKYVDDSNHAKGVKMTRPLCPYPQVAKYKGSGDTNDAANFVCAPGLR
ncbi:MAG TPA: tannase/feruloyl esterase family alpha/beta hydrolase [Terriglobia bacterium]|nr:tannase/feruloyl esterase family alpha/beta hydrolase [Terriglobia bacterium]